jgi:hypothetical protein
MNNNENDKTESTSDKKNDFIERLSLVGSGLSFMKNRLYNINILVTSKLMLAVDAT